MNSHEVGRTISIVKFQGINSLTQSLAPVLIWMPYFFLLNGNWNVAARLNPSLTCRQDILNTRPLHKYKKNICLHNVSQFADNVNISLDKKYFHRFQMIVTEVFNGFRSCYNAVILQTLLHELSEKISQASKRQRAMTESDVCLTGSQKSGSNWEDSSRSNTTAKNSIDMTGYRHVVMLLVIQNGR